MRVCVVYDCLFPHSIGGAERWYQTLSAELTQAGHTVTYLTRRQWQEGAVPHSTELHVIAVSPGGPLYTESGRRTIGSPLRFGLGVLRHLLTHRRHYDVVHTANFPFFPLLAARLALLGTPTRVAVDWHEVWTRDYWEEYLGRVGGLVGHRIQSLCVRLSPVAFVFSDLHAARLHELGLRRPAIKLDGEYAGSVRPGGPEPAAQPPVVMFAGRLIREKRAAAIPAAIAELRAHRPDVRAVVFGDGPERGALKAAIREAGVEDAVESPGFVDTQRLERSLATASVMLLPSSREGYGMIVIEAAAAGIPSVLVAGPDNAATELIDEGVNGRVAADSEPATVAAALDEVIEAGELMRRSTREWFERNAERLSARRSARRVVAVYEGGGG